MMSVSTEDIATIWLSIKLASTVTGLLLIIATPIAYWLAFTPWRLRGFVSAFVALPLVLPPTVIGFYFLLLLGPHGPVGAFTQWLGLGVLPFTFWGLVIASLFYSLPFVVQPIQNSIEAVGRAPVELAATWGAGKVERFFYVIFPLSRNGFITAAVLGFAHTVGEFGVVLMIGGSIPGSTKVASVQIYEHVEALQYGQAHGLALILVIFSFIALSFVYSFNKKLSLFRTSPRKSQVL